MAKFVATARELGFTRVEANASVSSQGLNELIQTSIPISSIHCPCPVVLSSRGIPIANLSLSSIERSEREEAVNFARRTIELARKVDAGAVILHVGEVPIDPGLEVELHQLYRQNLTQTERYKQIKEQLIYQRASQATSYLEAARKSLEELSQYSQEQGIMLGLETRFYFHEIPNIEEMEDLLNEMEGKSVGYWHDVGHAEVQQRLGFASHKEWLSRFSHKMIGIHLHDVIGLSDHRSPGKGNVDWEMVAKHLPHKAIKVCEIAEWNEEEQIQGVVNFLREKEVMD